MACATCKILQCANTPDVALYSLENNAFFNPQYTFVLNCPPGYSCIPDFYPNPITIPPGTITYPPPPIIPGQPTPVNMLCCNTTLSDTIPANATSTQISSIMNALIQQCAEQMAICQNINNPPTGCPNCPPPIPPGSGNQFSNDAVYYSACDITEVLQISGTVPGWITVDAENNRLIGLAGTFRGDTKALANAAAQSALNSFATSSGHVVCVCFETSSTLPDGSIGDAYSQALQAAGSPQPGFVFQYTVTSGALPDGLTLDSSTGIISGTPTTEESQTFTVTITQVPA